MRNSDLLPRQNCNLALTNVSGWGQSSTAPIAPAAPAVIAFNHLKQLRAQKAELEQKRPLIFADKDLENAISAIDAEIAKTQTALDQLAHGGVRK